MIQKSPWIDRHFTFDLPISMFPNVLERLRGTPARLEDRIQKLDPAILIKRVGESWSMQENVGHFLQTERLLLLRLDDYDSGRAMLHPADMTNSGTKEENYNQVDISSLLGAFRETRDHIVRRLESLDHEGVSRSAHHSRLNQSMRVLDLMIFTADHDDHHLARITELLRIIAGTI